MPAISKEEFKRRWESGPDGGGITFDDIADCAKDWHICACPRIHNIYEIRDKVLAAAGTSMDS